MRPRSARFAVVAAALAIGAAGLSSVGAVRRAVAEDAPPAPRPPPPPPVADEADWGLGDPESRWVRLVASNATSEAWTAFLARRDDPADWIVVEWLAMTASSSSALDAMAKAGTAAWIRTTVWRLESSDSHTMDRARLLLERRGPELLAWLRRFPAAETGEAARLASALRAKGVAPAAEAAVASQLPPLDAAVVLRELNPPAHVEDLGTARAVKDGVVYRHQVERAIDILLATKWRGDPWLARLTALLRHEDAAVRTKAALAFAAFPPDLVPVDTLLAMLDDAAQPVAVRSAALLSASRSRHPRAYVRLCDVVLDPAHPAWSAAVSRLGEESDEVSAKILLAAAERSGTDPRVDARAKAAAVLQRVADAGPAAVGDLVPVLLARAAWADLASAPSRGAIVPAVLARLGEARGNPAVRGRLERIVSSSTGLLDAVAPELAANVRDLAQRVLDGERPQPPR